MTKGGRGEWSIGAIQPLSEREQERKKENKEYFCCIGGILERKTESEGMD